MWHAVFVLPSMHNDAGELKHEEDSVAPTMDRALGGDAGGGGAAGGGSGLGESGGGVSGSGGAYGGASLRAALVRTSVCMPLAWSSNDGATHVIAVLVTLVTAHVSLHTRTCMHGAAAWAHRAVACSRPACGLATRA